jgi:hypothetical protein
METQEQAFDRILENVRDADLLGGELKTSPKKKNIALGGKRQKKPFKLAAINKITSGRNSNIGTSALTT